MSENSDGIWRPAVLTAKAPAKINLALHVTGRRADGYHLLDSLAAFASIGDRLGAAPSQAFSFKISGPFAEGLSSGNNLVCDAVKAYCTARRAPFPAIALELEKNLPVASGIGGGSADAAATLRLLTEIDSAPLDPDDLQRIALALGADVPVCLRPTATRMAGIGEQLIAVPDLPETGIVLVNSGHGVSTPDVFRALEKRDNAPLPEVPNTFPDRHALTGWLQSTRNDLEPPARVVCLAIDEVLARLGACPGVEFARMSGSGATCFGLCVPEQAHDIASALRSRHPDWWVAAGTLS